jgi:LacI family transcriptional regulator
MEIRLHTAYLSPAYHTGSRLAAYRDGLASAAIAEPETVYYADWSVGAAAVVAEGILSGSNPPTAIVCGNDILAAGVYRAARQAGLRIPQDLSVAAFNCSNLSDALEPRLTTMTNPGAEVGRAAVRFLLALLRGEQPEPVSVRSSLVVGGSTAPPR